MKKYGIVLIALAIFTGLLYGNSLKNSWHFDDYPNIVENPNVHLKTLGWDDVKRSLQGIPGRPLPRPVSYLSLALNYYAGQLDVRGYHIVNAVIHYLAAVCLFLFLHRVLNLPLIKKNDSASSYAIAFLSAVLWIVNPVQVTGVTYIVQRMTSLCALFYILAMLFYVEARMAESRSRGILFGSLCLLAALASLGSKENGVMLPVSLFLLDWLVIQGITWKRLKRNLFTVVLLLAVLLVVGSFYTSSAAILGGYGQRPFTLEERLLTQPRVIIFYLSLLLYPSIDRLTLLHDIRLSTSLLDPWTTIPAMIAIIGMIALALALARKRPFISFCLLFFFVNHLIESSFIPLELVYEHRNYLPSMLLFTPLAMGAVYVLNRFAERPVWRGAALLVLSMILILQGMTVVARNEVFRDEWSLWADNVEKAPDSLRPRHNLGVVYLSMGRLAEGRAELVRALHARDVSGIYNKTHTEFHLGRYYRMIGDDVKAMMHFQEALKIAEFNPEPHHALAEMMLKRNDLVRAEHHIGRALALKPEEGAYHLTYSTILLKKEWPDAAIAEVKRAIRYGGDASRAYSLMADAYRSKGDKAAALSCRRLADGRTDRSP